MRLYIIFVLSLVALVSGSGSSEDELSDTTPKPASQPDWFTRVRCSIASQVSKISRRILLLLQCARQGLGVVPRAAPAPFKVTPEVSLLDRARGLPPVTGSFTEFLYKNLVVADRQSVNVAVSPLGAEVVLAAVGVGARSYTQRELYRVLQVQPDTVTVTYRDKITALDLKNIQSVKMATKVYLEKTFFPVKKAFKKALSEVFGTELESADFIKGSTGEISRINKFVEEATEGNIKDAVTRDDVNEGVPILLLNVIYFKGEWEIPFKRSLGFNSNFLLPNKQTSKATFMRRTEEYSYYKEVPEGKFRMVELPYLSSETTGQFSMIIVLPDTVDSLADVERHITADDRWLREFDLTSTDQVSRVKVTLPRFTIDIRVDLKQTLNKMGVSALFEDSADLQGITITKELKVTNLQQRVFIDVDERGTKAAAATSASTAEIKGFDSNPIIEFTADHPFLFAIIQRTTKTVLFMGHVAKPNYDSLFAATEEGSRTGSSRSAKDKAFVDWIMGKGPAPEDK